MTKMIQCKNCGRIFAFGDAQQEFFKERSWEPPVRCEECRKLAKQRRKDRYWGWQSTMGGTIPAKKGHRRVNYPAHVVGGFR